VPGFLVGVLFLCFEPLVAPLLFLIFAWATTDVVQNDVGWDYSGQWWIWVLVAAAIVFYLTYRDVRLSTKAGVVLGIFEVAVFVALAAWMILSNLGDLTLSTFDPSNAADGTFNGTFKGMVFAILAFIGFEAAAPLGEEARQPRWTVPRAVVLSAFLIGLFYVFCAYAWVIGTGFTGFTDATLAEANPWRHLGDVYWSGGWVLIFFAIINSALANANAGFNAASRVIYAMGRNRILPAAFGRTHPEHRTPHVAIIAQTVLGVVVALLLGWKWGPLNGFGTLSYALTTIVILVYITVCVSTVVYYRREHAARFHAWLHGVFPIAGALAFVPPLYYQYRPLPPYPLRWGLWGALTLLAFAIVVTIWMATSRRDRLNPDLLFVVGEGGEEAPETAPAPVGA
jgi:amino acid transporter